MHEHVIIAAPEMVLDYPALIGWDRELVVDRAVRDLDACHAKGVRTIVDLTVPGLGRQAALVAEAARRSQLNVVMATGYYTLGELPPSLQLRGPGRFVDVAEPLAAMFLGDIEVGIAGTGVKAGMLKCVTDRAGMTSDVRRILRAVAVAHTRTGVPISTHTSAARRTGLDQQEFLSAQGVDLGRVIIGHCGDTTDLDYLLRLIDNGSYIGMDRFGLEGLGSFADRIGTVAKLCGRGLAGRIVLSQDACSFHDGLDEAWRQRAAPRWTHSHIADDVLPALRDLGVTDAQLDTMLIENPRRILGRGDEPEAISIT
jgi:phosphotriesterase-related protein